MRSTCISNDWLCHSPSSCWIYLITTLKIHLFVEHSTTCTIISWTGCSVDLINWNPHHHKQQNTGIYLHTFNEGTLDYIVLEWQCLNNRLRKMMLEFFYHSIESSFIYTIINKLCLLKVNLRVFNIKIYYNSNNSNDHINILMLFFVLLFRISKIGDNSTIHHRWWCFYPSTRIIPFSNDLRIWACLMVIIYVMNESTTFQLSTQSLITYHPPTQSSNNGVTIGIFYMFHFSFWMFM